MLTVAFATENNNYDGEVYRFLLEQILGVPVTAWKSQSRFNGWKSVLHLAEPYLVKAAEQGVRHAVLAIDNDGGLKRHPEHEPDHDARREVEDPDNGCRFCHLADALPKTWSEAGNKRCLIVPVQTLETWLLFLQGDQLRDPPESVFYRPHLKKLFFGNPLPPEDKRTAMALEVLRRDGAISKLRERRSFRLFEEQLADWK
jgi:hypothetical protein